MSDRSEELAFFDVRGTLVVTREEQSGRTGGGIGGDLVMRALKRVVTSPQLRRTITSVFPLETILLNMVRISSSFASRLAGLDFGPTSKK